MKLLLLLLLSLLLFTCCSDPPQLTETASEDIDVMLEPSQERVDEAAFPVLKEDCSFTITPLAEYEIHAQVKSTQNYNSGWQKLLSRTDLALAWGNLAQKEMDNYVTYSQSNRWYYYRYTGDFPYDPNYIGTHSANNHILSASDNVQRAIYSLRKNNNVRLKGYLVKVSGVDSSGNAVWWNSSLSRGDSGDGACEVFWVTEVQIQNNIYR